ncbi:hypothetical protein BSK59_13280 [Paenibacillus odorifer]|uniref:hypothetical protein n=1 Tax=Paenibacillus odorifer TaxID=189426 RepID=UPI00096ED944|nr:hypothetical protein [Paenibacillus odorifer]OME55444.1 hypothetical protein BSK59_13280 [Paenibacillus odorifer]
MIKSLITEEMVEKFNEILKLEESPLVLDKTRSGTYEITIKDKYLKYITIALTEDFYKKLESFFLRGYGIEKLSYNNTGSTFWAFG